jgi:hypothetical protein
VSADSMPKSADDVAAFRWVDPSTIDAVTVFSARGQMRLLRAYLRQRGCGKGERRSGRRCAGKRSESADAAASVLRR